MSDEDYVTEAGPSVQRRRAQRRAMAVLLALLLGLFFAFWYAWSYYKDARDNTSAPKVCVTAPVTAAPKVSLNVYNATTRDGLAAATAKTMTTRGYTIGKVTNDPLKKKVAATAEIRSGKAGAANAKLVAGNVPGAKLVVDARKDASVDLVLGDGFKALATKAVRPATPTPSVTCR